MEFGDKEHLRWLRETEGGVAALKRVSLKRVDQALADRADEGPLCDISCRAPVNDDGRCSECGIQIDAR